MRTKALLLTAALGLASVATTMAQVYSVNVVGYINVPLGPGYSLIANQLNASPNNQLNTVIPTAPVLSQVQKFTGTGFNVDLFDGTGWVDGNTGDPSTTTVSPGEGFFFFNPEAAFTTTLVGEVRTGNGLSVPLGPGYSLISSIVPQEISLTAANGFPQVVLMQYQSYNGAGFDVLLNDGTGWVDANTGDPADARPKVGQGFFIFNPEAAVNWTRDFNPNTP
jgi:hypothetical protein